MKLGKNRVFQKQENYFFKKRKTLKQTDKKLESHFWLPNEMQTIEINIEYLEINPAFLCTNGDTK